MASLCPRSNLKGICARGSSPTKPSLACGVDRAALAPRGGKAGGRDLFIFSPPYTGERSSIPLHSAGIGPVDDAAVAAGEPGDLLHLRGAERKIEDRRV